MSQQELEARLNALEHMTVLLYAASFQNESEPLLAMRHANRRARELADKLGHPEFVEAIEGLFAGAEILLETKALEMGN